MLDQEGVEPNGEIVGEDWLGETSRAVGNGVLLRDMIVQRRLTQGTERV